MLQYNKAVVNNLNLNVGVSSPEPLSFLVTKHKTKPTHFKLNKVRRTEERNCIYCIYRVTKLWKILIIAVDADYARRGIATALLNRSLDLARELHIPLAVSNFSSLFTQRIAIRLGFETVYEGVYSEKYALYHQIPETIKNTHKSCLAMAKLL